MNNNQTHNYSLKDYSEETKISTWKGLKKMWPHLKDEKKNLVTSTVMTVLNALANLIIPLGIGYSIDKYVIPGDYHGIFVAAGVLLAVAAIAFVTNYVQYRVMGGVAQRVLWGLRDSLFAKLQELPLAFFTANKTGDLISRVNDDTDKVNDFFSQSLLHFIGTIFMVLGAGIFILVINWKLGLVALAPAVILIIYAWLVAGWVGRTNKESSKAKGLLSAEIQESIANFKIIIAFNRRDYFKKRFGDANSKNFKGAIKAGIANELYTPVFEWMGNVAFVITLAYGLYLISQGALAIGLLSLHGIASVAFFDLLQIFSLFLIQKKMEKVSSNFAMCHLAMRRSKCFAK